MLGFEEPFMYRMVDAFAELMGYAYPELRLHQSFITKLLLSEEERFLNTLHQGLRELDTLVEAHRTDGTGLITGQEAFKLYDTFGFPIDLAEEVAQDAGMQLDRESFESVLDATRQQARETWKGSGEVQVAPVYQDVFQRLGASQFTGYDQLERTEAVAALIVDGREVEQADEGQEVEIVFAQTPFYGESGGQVGDQGQLLALEDGIEIEITDTQKPLADLIVHNGVVKHGRVATGMPLQLRIDNERREAIRKNHTATHLLHAALRQILGDHVKQAGSLVAPDRLRFDFTHFARLSERELERIERLVNEQLWDNTAVQADITTLDNALASGAMALFGEKYGEDVRTIEVPGFSKELCGGTHVRATGEIGFFTITSEAGIGSGVRRIEALTGPGAYDYIKRDERILSDMRQMLKAQPEEEMDKLERLSAQQRDLERQIAALQQRLASSQTQDYFSDIKEVSGVKVLALNLEDFDRKTLRSFVDTAKDRIGSGVVLVGAVEDDKVSLVAGVTKDLTDRISAGALMGKIAPLLGGKGGGRPDMAQGGGTDVAKLPEAIAQVPALVADLL